MKQSKIMIKTHKDIVRARQAGRDAAAKSGFRLADQTRFATAISELTRNTLQYAGEGVCTITDESNEDRLCIRVDVEDYGPGIPDVDKAMTQGFSTSKGLGAGLPGTKKLVQDFQLDTKPGYTKISIKLIRSRY